MRQCKQTPFLYTHHSLNLISRLLVREKRNFFSHWNKPHFTCSTNWSTLSNSTVFYFHWISCGMKGASLWSTKSRKRRDVCQHCGIISVENVKGKEWAIKAPAFLSFFILTMKEQSSLSSQSVKSVQYKSRYSLDKAAASRSLFSLHISKHWDNLLKPGAF